MARIVMFALAMLCCGGIATSIGEEARQPESRYSAWTKVCVKGPGYGVQTCLTGRDAMTNCGPVGSSVLIERDGDATKTLRVTLPPGVSQQNGMRTTIGQGEPIDRSFTGCFPSGCMADHTAGAELVTQLKQEQSLLIEGVDSAGRSISARFTLDTFAQAYDGPSIEPTAFERQQQTRIRTERLPKSGEAKRPSDEDWRRAFEMSKPLECETKP
jgi:invasion protein IalB